MRERFTAAEIIAITGLKPESVRTELQRLKSRGYLTAQPPLEKTGRRGRQLVQYHLSEDPAKRAELEESIRLFDPPALPAEVPTSIYYEHAVVVVNQALEASAIDRRECKRLLLEAEEYLEDAWVAEGGDRASPAIQECFIRQRNRMEALRDDPTSIGGTAAVAVSAIASSTAMKSACVTHDIEQWQLVRSILYEVVSRPNPLATQNVQYAIHALGQNFRTREDPLFPLVVSLLNLKLGGHLGNAGESTVLPHRIYQYD